MVYSLLYILVSLNGLYLHKSHMFSTVKFKDCDDLDIYEIQVCIV